VNIFGYFVTALAILYLASCAPRVALGPVRMFYPEIRPVEIELTSFSFQPDHLVILRDHSPPVFRLTNTAKIWHNFSLLDPHQKSILKKDIKPNESVTFTIELLDPENYTFYCARFLHRFLGMEGMLMVE
jgi:plastocyanin